MAILTFIRYRPLSLHRKMAPIFSQFHSAAC